MPRAEREELILGVAGATFAQDGYHGASMDEMAAAAGVSKPMLYAYFGSKEGLYLAYLARAGRELIERLEHVFATDDPTPVRMRSRVEAFLVFVEEYRDGWRVLWHEANASAPVAEETAQLRAQITDTVRRLLLAGPAGAVLHRAAAEAAAHAIVGSGEALANWWLERPEVPREQVAEWYAAVIQASVAAIARSA
jgi:AcrR family transcriptional regulator